MNNHQIELHTVTFSNGKFSISAQEAKNIAIEMFGCHFGIGWLGQGYPYINEKGQVCRDEYERNYVDTKVLRKATVMDKMAEKIIGEFVKNACTDSKK